MIHIAYTLHGSGVQGVISTSGPALAAIEDMQRRLAANGERTGVTWSVHASFWDAMAAS